MHDWTSLGTSTGSRANVRHQRIRLSDRRTLRDVPSRMAARTHVSDEGASLPMFVSTTRFLSYLDHGVT